MKYCPRCGTQLDDSSIFCIECGQKQGEPVKEAAKEAAKEVEHSSESVFSIITETINKLSGGSGVVRPPLRSVFSEVFKKHSRSQSEEIFACGTEKTTPGLEELDGTWPKPWLFSRVLLAFLLAFIPLYICCSEFDNINALPGLLIVGSFMGPIAVMVFFFEFNIRKNISFFNTIKIFMVGGCFSLLFTLILFEIVQFDGQLTYWGATIVGIVEEVGKLGIVYFFLKQEKNADYLSNGLLVGAAIGAGFAAFESAGYAFTYFILSGYNYDIMMDVIMVRGVLSPGGHVVWAAISGYALVLAKGQNRLSIAVLGDKRFLRLFCVPVVLHAVWDMPITFGQDYYLIQILLTVAAWIVVFVLIDNCLKQVAVKVAEIREKKQSEEENGNTDVSSEESTEYTENISNL